MRDTIAQQQGIGHCELYIVVLVGLKGGLVSDVRMEVSVSLHCNELATDRGHSVLPVVPGTSEFFLTESEGSFFSNKTAMVVDISE